MESQRHFELYLEQLRQWGTPEQIGKLLRWGSPEEVAAILRASGSPEEVAELVQALRERADQWAWNKRFWGQIKTAAIAAGLVGGVCGAIIAVLTLAERLRALWPG